MLRKNYICISALVFPYKRRQKKKRARNLRNVFIIDTQLENYMKNSFHFTLTRLIFVHGLNT